MSPLLSRGKTRGSCFIRSGSCSPSCRGIFRSGRSCASRRPRYALATLRVVVIASNCSAVRLRLEELFLDAGAPAGVFQALLVGSDRVESLIAGSAMAAVRRHTGSEAAGVFGRHRSRRSLKKTVLELGGSDPFIVMPSADLEAAVSVAVKARVINNGQSCIAAKRFIVHESIYDDFRQRFTSAMRALRVGDPMDAHTDVGPLATRQIRDELHVQVEKTVAMGARVLT